VDEAEVEDEVRDADEEDRDADEVDEGAAEDEDAPLLSALMRSAARSA
jgi:hypothetical protein